MRGGHDGVKATRGAADGRTQCEKCGLRGRSEFVIVVLRGITSNGRLSTIAQREAHK